MYKEIFGFCIRRSGHSAMCNWIAGHVDFAMWYSDCYEIHPGTHQAFCTITCKKGAESIMEKKKTYLPIPRDPAEDMRIYSFEDNLSNPFTLSWIVNTVEMWRTVREPIVLFTLRDADALYRSQKDFGNNKIPESERVRSQAILRDQIEWTKTGKIPYKLLSTDYEKWCESKSYRKSISRFLKLPFSDSRRYEILSDSSWISDSDPKGYKIISKRWK